jgi:hypothetical protein
VSREGSAIKRARSLPSIRSTSRSHGTIVVRAAAGWSTEGESGRKKGRKRRREGTKRDHLADRQVGRKGYVTNRTRGPPEGAPNGAGRAGTLDGRGSAGVAVAIRLVRAERLRGGRGRRDLILRRATKLLELEKGGGPVELEKPLLFLGPTIRRRPGRKGGATKTVTLEKKPLNGGVRLINAPFKDADGHVEVLAIHGGQAPVPT